MIVVYDALDRHLEAVQAEFENMALNVAALIEQRDALQARLAEVVAALESCHSALEEFGKHDFSGGCEAMTDNGKCICGLWEERDKAEAALAKARP